MARQAILTTYFGPGNTRGSRVQAKADAGTRYYGWDYAANAEDNHRAAALAFAADMGWIGADHSFESEDLIGGGMPQSSKEAYCWVFDDREKVAPTIATNTWKDAVVDALIEDRTGEAVQMIVSESGGLSFGEHGSPITTDDGKIPAWTLEAGRTFAINDAYIFSIHRVTSPQPNISPAPLDDLCHRMLAAFKAGLI